MTTYGTIPTSSSPANVEYISRAKDCLTAAGLGTRRPWREMMFEFRSFSIPKSFSDAAARLGTNAAYFRMNYAIVVLLILFLGLLWHPVSLIVFIATMTAWLFLYFLRDEPLKVFGRTIADSAVLTALAVATIGVLLLTRATSNILASLVVGVLVVVVHGAMRKTDDLFVAEEAAGGLLTRSSGGPSSSS